MSPLESLNVLFCPNNIPNLIYYFTITDQILEPVFFFFFWLENDGLIDL